MTDSLVVDTGQLAAITGRRPSTIRTFCSRGEHGYDHRQSEQVLADVRGEVVGFTAKEAEEALGIPANRIYQRAHVGHLRPIEHDAAGRPRYALHHLLQLWPDGP